MDYEVKRGKVFEPVEDMKEVFRQIDSVDAIVVELSEKGVGLGIEAGYAKAKGKRVIVIAKEGSDISESLAGIADEIIFYNDPKKIHAKLLNP